ncbi:cupin [alpha proteobacterium AAP81b]|nr:cupin [alpha proteobacterium AAP81b]
MRDPNDAGAIIAALGLAPHPEGGWYRETFRDGPGADGRSRVTAILFLLAAGETSHWHRVDAAEIWCWHAGAPLCLRLADGDAGPVSEVRLGAGIAAGETPQAIVPAGHWQAAVVVGGWALVSCVVAPGFDFAGFTLAPLGWYPGGSPG